MNFQNIPIIIAYADGTFGQIVGSIEYDTSTALLKTQQAIATSNIKWIIANFNYNCTRTS